MTLEIKDLSGLGQPLTKFIEVVSSGIGALYRPRAIRLEADARAYELNLLEETKAKAEVERDKLMHDAAIERCRSLEAQYPQLAERARYRLLAREIEGQVNVEEIANYAEVALPDVVSSDPVSKDWLRKFFKEAENVCDSDMQALWGRVLAGEVARPGRFSLRTLETLTQLSRYEAELFRKLCGLAMSNGFVALLSGDINTALMPYEFSFDSILQVRDAGLVQNGDNLFKSFSVDPSLAHLGEPYAFLRNNGVDIRLSGALLNNFKLVSLIFTRAGQELQSLIGDAPNELYLAEFGRSMRSRGLVVKRGVETKIDTGGSLISFEQDL